MVVPLCMRPLRLNDFGGVSAYLVCALGGIGMELQLCRCRRSSECVVAHTKGMATRIGLSARTLAKYLRGMPRSEGRDAELAKVRRSDGF